MKTELTMQSKSRPEGRLFPRRKVSTKSQLFNGVSNFEMELSIAIKESLKYSQPSESEFLNDREKSQQNSTEVHLTEEKESEITDEKCFVPENDHTLEEIERLKDLVLAQGELIQCQQEEIKSKDSEIKRLRFDYNSLQCRLERMERRLSILRQKDSHLVQPKNVHEEESTSKDYICGQIKRPINKGLELKRKNKNHHFTSKKHRQRKPVNEQETGPSEKISNEKSEDEISINSGSTPEENFLNESEEEKYDSEKDNSTVIDYPMMQTDTVYHLYYPKHLCPSPDSHKLNEGALLQLEVETPSWRLNPLTNLYQLEGTENITDEAYLKRHQKFEIEEKRRKRWDLQRMRELRLVENIEKERGNELRASENEADVESFLPAVQDITHIEITSSLPVMAFGQPVPYVSPGEFEIPWEMNSTTSYSRQKGSNSRRQ